MERVDGLRRCALALHAVAPADREWILGKMPGSQAGPLRAMLSELRSLGVPPDQSLVRSAIVSRRSSDTQLDSALVAISLSLEAPRVRELALATLSVEDRTSVLAAMDGATRSSLQRLAPGDVPVRLRRALLSELGLGLTTLLEPLAESIA